MFSKINENGRTSLPPRAPGRSLTFVTSEKDVTEGFACELPLTEGGAPAQSGEKITFGGAQKKVLTWNITWFIRDAQDLCSLRDPLDIFLFFRH